MQHSTDRILTTHTGSLPRPPALLELLKAQDDGETVDAARFDAVAQAAIAEVVRLQVDAGIDVLNDGEMSKISYSTYVKNRLNGFGGQGAFPAPADVVDHPDYMQQRFGGDRAIRLKTPACIGEVSWRDRGAVDVDINRFKQALQGVAPREAFMTAASPGVIAMFLENRHYPDEGAYLDAVADVMRDEYEAIVAAGFLLQLDCPDLAVGRHSKYAQTSTAEFLAIVKRNVAAINRAVKNIPAGRIRMHLCWGNYEGPHHRDIPLREIIEAVFEARVTGISFEAANPRHAHEWTVFEELQLPEGKVLIPGVLDTSTNYVEHPELIAQRIIRYAELVGRENVIAGSDCGFSTFAGAAAVAPSVTWAKLRALSEGAALASKKLWGVRTSARL